MLEILVGLLAGTLRDQEKQSPPAEVPCTSTIRGRHLCDFKLLGIGKS